MTSVTVWDDGDMAYGVEFEYEGGDKEMFGKIGGGERKGWTVPAGDLIVKFMHLLYNDGPLWLDVF